MRGTALILSGPSGVGKTKITRAVAETLDAFLSVSVTTRPSADTEVKGVDYKFVDSAKFDEMRQNGEFLEWSDKFGFSYGTLRQPVEHALSAGKPVILEIDVEGAKQVKYQMPECHAIFILPPDEHVLLSRLRRRGRDTEEDILTRLSSARREIAQAEASGVYEYFVVNEDLESALSDILSWIRCEAHLKDA